MAAMESMRYAGATMSEDKPEAPQNGRKKSGSMFWWGILAGFAAIALVFAKPMLGLLRDALANVLPVFFTPGILEISLGVIGFGLVIVINYLLLRREGQDEWVELPDDED
jgi:hypothetical protein